jgi:hypothetical protein
MSRFSEFSSRSSSSSSIIASSGGGGGGISIGSQLLGGAAGGGCPEDPDDAPREGHAGHRWPRLAVRSFPSRSLYFKCLILMKKTASKKMTLLPMASH